jgi:hypothetical protein
MSISGSLEDVAVADVLQFIYLGKRTGTLELEEGGERARFAFHEGTLVGAQAPGAPRLGDLLVVAGHLSAEELARVVELQSAEGGRRTLGQILVDAGRIAPALLETIVRQKLQGTVDSVMGWVRGSFDFALDEIRPLDDIAIPPPTFDPDESIPANVVLLEAARIFDAHGRPAAAVMLEDDAAVAEAAIDALVDDEESRVET